MAAAPSSGEMRCPNGHENSDVELFCSVCGAVMPPLGQVLLRPIRWRDEPEPPEAPRRDPVVEVAPLPRAELRRRRHPWRYRLKTIARHSRH